VLEELTMIVDALGFVIYALSSLGYLFSFVGVPIARGLDSTCNSIILNAQTEVINYNFVV